MRQAFWIRMSLSLVAFVGTAAPVASIIQWDEFGFFALIAGGLAVSLVLYVLFIRTRAMSITTGAFLVLFAVGLPIPGYPIYFFGVRYGFAGEALLLLGIPPLALLAFLIGLAIDVGLRSERTRPSTVDHLSRPTPPLVALPPIETPTMVRPAQPLPHTDGDGWGSPS